MTGGFTMAAFYVAAVLTAPVSLLLLLLYRRAVTSAMQVKRGATTTPRQEVETQHREPRGPLLIDVIDAEGHVPEAPACAGVGAPATNRVMIVYAAAGGLFILVLVVATHATVEAELLFAWASWWFVLDSWPLALTAGIVRGAVGRDWIRIWGWYAISLAAVSIVCLVVYEGLSISVLLSNALTAVLIALPVTALLYRPVRAVGMLVFAFLLLVLVGTPAISLVTLQGFTAVAGGDGRWQSPALFLLAGLGTEGLVVLIIVLMIFATGASAWWILRRLGSAYRRKRLSDRSLLLDSMWAVVAIGQVVMLSTQGRSPGSGLAWIALPVAGFGIYWLTTRVGFRLRFDEHPDPGPLLLWLRVFALGKRSDRLLRVLEPSWLRSGSLTLIAGPDLATGTVQPNQFLEYIARRLRAQFVASDQDLDRRIADLDLLPDPDGRYRINQLFCFADTWQYAVSRLSQKADAVLMDLREFSPENQGCLYELQTLARHVRPDRVLLLIDEATDWPFLETTLRRLWVDSTRRAEGPAGEPRRLRAWRSKSTTAVEGAAIMRMLQPRGSEASRT